MTGLCPKCGKLIESKEVVEGGFVYLQKMCPEHGIEKTLISTDSGYWNWAMKYNRPGRKPFRWSSAINEGCPEDCGICPSHKQHTCVGIIEITGACNLKCNVCFADAPFGEHLPLDTIKSMIESFVSYENNPEILQLSGGEPTLHPDLIKIVEYAKMMEIEDVVVSTNGLKLLDINFAKELKRVGAVIYLQFDTFSSKASELIRGKDLVKQKHEIVEICNALGLTTVLVPTLIKGINEGEIGQLISYALKQPSVFGINFQPFCDTGRFEFDNASSLCVDEILRLIEEETNGSHTASEFRPIPCPHPHCTSISYVLVDNESNEVTPLTEIVDVDEYIDYGKDRTLVSKSILKDESFESLFSTSAVAGTERTTGSFCGACGISVHDIMGQTVKTIAVHAFMDRDSYQLERVQKCCIHVIQPDGKMIPFCNYNLIHNSRTD
jgi:uncharacterized radical SAM superfamily Fe-S cluster-containing enzyme